MTDHEAPGLRVIGGYWRAEAKGGRAVDAAVTHA